MNSLFLVIYSVLWPSSSSARLVTVILFNLFEDFGASDIDNENSCYYLCFHLSGCLVNDISVTCLWLDYLTLITYSHTHVSNLLMAIRIFADAVFSLISKRFTHIVQI